MPAVACAGTIAVLGRHRRPRRAPPASGDRRPRALEDGQRTVGIGAQRRRRTGGVAAARHRPSGHAQRRRHRHRRRALRHQQAAEMYVLEQGALRLAWSGGMTNSNGLGFSPDRRTMYHSDTAAHRVTRYAYDMATGAVSDQQLFQQFSTDKTAPDYGGRPDGATVDSAGNYWCALFEGARVLCISPQGVVLEEVRLPVRCPTMLAFGGADLRTLYITSASHNRPPAELAQYPHNGKVLKLRLAIPGQPEPAYQE